MKVFFLIDSLEGYGAEKSIVQIALHLKEVTPVFIHLHKGDKLKKTLVSNGVKVYSLGLDCNFSIKMAVDLVIPIINSEKPNILHSTLFTADMVARKLKLIFPDIILVGSFVSNSYSFNRYKHLSPISKLKLLSTQWKDKMTAKEVDFFICNSNAIKKANMNALGVSSEKVKVIFRGRNFEDYLTTEEAVLSLRKELNLYDKKIFLNVSRLHKGKGQLDLLKAFKVVSDKNHELVLLIAGEGPFRNNLQRTIQKLNLENKVFLLGYREDIPELLELADYFVFPSYFEGLPGSLIEAIISKLPCIVSNISENMECFPPESNLNFPSGNINVLANKLAESLSLEDWDLKTEKAYQFALCNFNIKSVSDRYEKFYRNIYLNIPHS